jgi:hypothetical protein
MTPKPFYHRLLQMLKKEWTTDVKTRADAAGHARMRCYFGEHVVEARLPSGEILKGAFTLEKKGKRSINVVVG